MCTIKEWSDIKISINQYLQYRPQTQKASRNEMVSVEGIEPSSPLRQSGVLPVNYTLNGGPDGS